MKTMKIIFAALMTIPSLVCANSHHKDTERPLKEAVAGKFRIGTALNSRQINGKDSSAIRLVKRHFNDVVAENCMKCETIHPSEDRYNFAGGDSLVAFAEENGMSVTGHCLIWHSQLAKWFPYDSNGNLVSADVLKERMRKHIHTVVGRYKGKVRGWDVVNEAIEGDGTYRKSVFYDILGEEFIPLAFQFAHEADPDAELYYNDFGMDSPKKRAAVISMVEKLKKRGIRIDAVGMQGHMGMDYPNINEFENSIKAFAAAGVNVMITEWDMSALPTVHTGANISDIVDYQKAFNPYPDGLPDSISQEWNNRMHTFFQLFLKHSDVITRVTAWGVSDGDSWKNDFPVQGRTDYPLLFDRNHQPKDFIWNFCAYR